MRDAFREKRFLADPQRIYKEYAFGIEQLQLLKRQVPRHFGSEHFSPSYSLVFLDAVEPDVFPAKASCGKN